MINNQKTKFAFFGTPSLAADLLEALKGAGFVPAVIITNPDQPVGRKMIVTPPPVKTWAIENNIECLQPTSLKDSEFISQLSKVNCQMFLVAAYGKIIPESILQIPQLGSFNVHYSLLPKYRGATPVESAILNGDIETGVSIQKMVYELDAGDVVASEKTEIRPDETAPELRMRLNEIAKSLLIKTTEKIISENIAPETQDPAKATFCHKIKKEDGLINLTADPKTNYLKYRAY
ncbi:MAG: methionyl-tRNA formyltransferase, partial [Candidatus Paceibacterota bacterium]